MVKKTEEKVVEVTLPEQELAKYETLYTRLTGWVTLKVVDERSKGEALEAVRGLEELGEKYKKFRDGLISEDVRKMQKWALAREKIIKEVVGKYDCGLRGELSKWETLQSQIREKEEAKLREAQIKAYEKQVKKADAKGSIPPPPPPVISIDKPKEDGVTYTDKPVVEVIDFKLVPDECKLLNEKVAIARAKLGVKDPGLRVTWIKTARIGEAKSVDVSNL